MIKIGIDSIEIARFIPWTQYPKKKLLRVFTSEEISYCFLNSEKAPERLAARFSAKEAFYKAFAPLLPRPVPFLVVAKSCSISVTTTGAPFIIFPLEKWGLPPHQIELTLTHTKTTATAMVLLYGH
jgi:phosphopantetheine--protein transferase-like protein